MQKRLIGLVEQWFGSYRLQSLLGSNGVQDHSIAHKGDEAKDVKAKSGGNWRDRLDGCSVGEKVIVVVENPFMEHCAINRWGFIVDKQVQVLMNPIGMNVVHGSCGWNRENRSP